MCIRKTLYFQLSDFFHDVSESWKLHWERILNLHGFLTVLDVPGLRAQCEHELLSFCRLCFLTLPGAKCAQSVFSGILWLHPCWRLRTPDQSMAIVWTTWESDAWQAFANYIKNYQESNYILNYLHVYEIYATAAVWLITESQKMQGFKTTAKCRSMLTISVNHNTVEYVSYIKHTFLFVDISCKHIDIVIC